MTPARLASPTLHACNEQRGMHAQGLPGVSRIAITRRGLLSERSSQAGLSSLPQDKGGPQHLSLSLSCTQKGIQPRRYALLHACEVCAVSMRLASPPANPNL